MTAPTLSSAALDRLLAVLVVLLAASGLRSLWAGAPSDAWLFVTHGLLAGVLAALVVMKVRRSVPRAGRERRLVRLALGLVITLAAAAALAGGYLWVASGELLWVDVPAIGRWTVLTLHAWIGLVLVPLVVVHVLPVRWRLLRVGPGALERAGRRVLNRRAFLVGAGLGVAGVGAWTAAALVERARGGVRRFTGSRWLPAGGIPIPTTFFGEPVPPVDHATWRLQVGGAVEEPGTFDLAALRALGDEERTAVLDCTSGWAMETTWRGLPLATLLRAVGTASSARRVEVRSVTGWATSLAMSDARRALLAWDVAGGPLPAANGAPLRLVAPDRRGLEWVKWIAEIRIA